MLICARRNTATGAGRQPRRWCSAIAEKNYSQCALVNYALGINYACGNATFQWDSYANSTNSAQGIVDLVQAGGVSAGKTGRLCESQVRAKIDANKPFILAWYWTSGGGHVVVAKGYSGSNLYLNDPWPGNGATVRTYAATAQASDRNWRESILTY